MDVFKKIAVLPICLSLILPGMAACAKKSSRPVPEGDFYNVSTCILGDYDPSEYDYLERDLMGMTSDRAVVFVDYSRPMPSDFDYVNGDYSLYQGQIIELYDMNGGFVSSYDIDDIKTMASLPENAYYTYIHIMCNDHILIEYEGIGTSDSRQIYHVFFDPLTDTVSGVSQSVIESDEHPVLLTSCGDRSVIFYGRNDSHDYLNIVIEEPSGERCYVDAGHLLAGYGLEYYGYATSVSDSKVLFQMGSGDYGEEELYILDIDSLSVSKTEDLGWIEDPEWVVYNSAYIEGQGVLCSDSEGISVYDLDSCEERSVVNYDRCDGNIFDLQSMSPLSVDNDRIIIGGDVIREECFELNSYPMLAILEKSDVDPYEGREAISLALLDSYLDYPTAEAIRIFNSQDPDYYVYFDSSYGIGRFADDQQADHALSDVEASVAMTNQLMIDYLAGEGPDMFMGGSSYSQFHNEDILADLSDLVDSGEVFENVIDAGQEEGKLYSIPLYFSISGICTDAGNVSPGQTEFDIEGYDEFVRTVCNGNNPVMMEQTEFFLLALRQMQSEFREEDGRVDYDNEEFRALAQYVNDNVTYTLPDEEDYEAWDMIYSPRLTTDYPALYMTFYSIWEFVGRFDPNQEIAMLGVPSYQGEGPSVNILQSVSVSASTPYRDGCEAFIEVLLSEPVQQIYGYQFATPVNIEAYEAAAVKTLEQYNAERARCVGWTSADFRNAGMSAPVDDFDIIYTYEDYIRSCTASASGDPAVELIIREEIPAYFAGQKTIDEVIGIIMNRIDTYLNERG